MRASGNTVLITGGGGNIGLALAREFVTAGNTVIITGRSAATLERAVRETPALIAMQGDVTNAAERSALVERVQREYPALNILVNNAGSLHVADLTAPTALADLDDEIATNLVAPLALTTALLPTLREQQKAAIVNVTTGWVYVPGTNTPHYSATKAALHSETLSLRYALRHSNVRVTEVFPPAVESAMSAHYGGAKMQAGPVARAMYRGIIAEKPELRIGVSRAAFFLSRLAPLGAVRFVNDRYLKDAVHTSTP